MAQQTIVRYTDDLDGSEASGGVEFALEGRSYEIDLSDKNAARLRDAFAPYIAAARRAGGGGRRSSSATAPAGQGRNLGEARTWLRENGYPVKDRGRIPGEWLRQFDAKTPQPPAVTKSDDQAKSDGSSNGHAVEFQSV
jgi:hypothetical protein